MRRRLRSRTFDAIATRLSFDTTSARPRRRGTLNDYPAPTPAQSPRSAPWFATTAAWTPATPAADDGDFLFILGTQKSGTSWLSDIISEIIPVASSAERWLPRFVAHIQAYLRTHHLRTQEQRDEIERRLVVDGWNQLFGATNQCRADKSAFPCVPGQDADATLFPRAVAMMKYYFPRSRQVMITRDPRDVFVSSMYFFTDIDFARSEDFLVAFMDTWAKCQLDWMLSDPTLVVRYEDMIFDLPGQIALVFAALGHDMGAGACRTIAARHGRRTRFDNPVFRKGIIGDWKTHLPARQGRLMFDRAREVMKLLGYDEDGPSTCSPPRARARRVLAHLGRHVAIGATTHLTLDRDCRAGALFRWNGETRLFVFRPGVDLLVNLSALPPPPPGYKNVLVLGLRPQRHCLDGGAASFSVWARADNQDCWRVARVIRDVQRDSFAFGQPITIAFDIPDDRGGGGRFIKIRLFEDDGADGAAARRPREPFCVTVDDVCALLVPGGSMIAARIGDGVDGPVPASAPSSPADPATADWTALHFASQFGESGIVECLLSDGADLDARAARGGTPLHRAVDVGDLAIARALLRRGCDVDVVDAERLETPRDLALRKRHWAVADLLAEHGGRRHRDLPPAPSDATAAVAGLDDLRDRHAGADIYVVSSSGRGHRHVPLVTAALAGMIVIVAGGSRQPRDPAYRVSCHVSDILIGADRDPGVTAILARTGDSFRLPAFMTVIDLRPLLPATTGQADSRDDHVDLVGAIVLALVLGARRIVHLDIDAVLGAGRADAFGRAADRDPLRDVNLEIRAMTHRWWLAAANCPPETPCGFLARRFAPRAPDGAPTGAVATALAEVARQAGTRGVEIISCARGGILARSGAREISMLAIMERRTPAADGDPSVIGYVDTMRVEHGSLVTSGWSVDERDPHAPCLIVLERDGVVLGTTRTTLRRDDVLVALQFPPDGLPGYHLEIPDFSGEVSSVAIYAVSGTVCRSLRGADPPD